MISRISLHIHVRMLEESVNTSFIAEDGLQMVPNGLRDEEHNAAFTKLPVLIVI